MTTLCIILSPCSILSVIASVYRKHVSGPDERRLKNKCARHSGLIAEASSRHDCQYGGTARGGHPIENLPNANDSRCIASWQDRCNYSGRRTFRSADMKLIFY